jgi:hypothetical protein
VVAMLDETMEGGAAEEEVLRKEAADIPMRYLSTIHLI